MDYIGFHSLKQGAVRAHRGAGGGVGPGAKRCDGPVWDPRPLWCIMWGAFHVWCLSTQGPFAVGDRTCDFPTVVHASHLMPAAQSCDFNPVLGFNQSKLGVKISAIVFSPFGFSSRPYFFVTFLFLFCYS